MSLHGKLEARIVIPSGDWTALLTESGGGGAQTITLTAATTYNWRSVGTEANDLAADLKAKLEAASVAAGNSNTYTVTISAGEGGTGKLMIAVSAGTFTLTSIDDDLQALMGFTAVLTPAAASCTGGRRVEGLWLPGCPVDTPYGLSSSGLVVSDAVETLSDDGTYSVRHGSKHVRNEYTWHAVAIAKTVAASEATTAASYETFWLDAIRGEEPWANAGRQLRWYQDADDDATYKTVNALNVRSPDIARLQPEYDGLWTVRLAVVEN